MQDDQTEETGNSKASSLESELYLVGIGSSAGGLEAIREFVGNLPKKSSAAFVIVQHLSPDHQSLLTTLIDRETQLTVVDIKDGVKLEADTIYVTPPNWDVMVRGDHLILERPSFNGGSPKPSVDHFFRSAAEAFGTRAVGVVFSGTGSDGAYGLQAIRGAGGLTLAQDDKSAKYDGMPNAAIETGCVDLILPPDEIARQLNKILTNPRNLEQFKLVDLNDNAMSDLLHIVLAETRVDFRDYKQTTIRRRIERRMTAVGIASLRDYTNFCRSSPSEINALFKDLLISVTRFFRDPVEFEKVRPFVDNMVQSAGKKPLRVWVVGCATGEEVYSVAMMFGEALGGVSALNKSRIQIFATDIDLAALDVGRSGVYSHEAVADIPTRFFDHFVHQKNGQVLVDQRVKDVVLFSSHNVCQDPPFLNIDLICCRNLLIYFSNRLQERVHSRLAYSLVPDGYLFLGKSESIHISDGLFDAVDRSTHLYRKRLQDASVRDVLAHSDSVSKMAQPRPRLNNNSAPKEKNTNLAMFEILASKVGPNSLLLTSDLQIIRVFGDVSPFSVLTDRSRLKFDISILRAELAMEARSLASVALKNNEQKKGPARGIKEDPGFLTQLECYPIKGESLDEDCVLIVFNRWPQPEEKKLPEKADFSKEATRKVDELEQEIVQLHSEYQQTVEELETTNEELQTTLEEFQSTNEELQSTNEEIETSNEELQSTNEELITVNEELQISTYEMNVLNDEQSAVLESMVSPILIVDVSMHITKANDAALKLMKLRRPIDRPHLSQCQLPEGFPVLSEICNKAINLGRPLNISFSTKEGINVLDCAPFFNSDGQLRGATLLFHRSPEIVQLLDTPDN